MLKDDKATYSYDEFNRTTKVETFDGNTQVNRYDAEGLRYEMEENGQLVQFIFNTEREVIAEQEENKWTIYIRGSELLASSSDYAKTYYHYATDEMGSITHIVDDKNILNHYEYDVWGNVVKQKETVKNRFKFTGEQLDTITQQYYLRARFYNPVIARFTQEDTYRGDGLNLYTYCRNNPIKYVDPTGNACEDIINNLYDARNTGTVWDRIEITKSNAGYLYEGTQLPISFNIETDIGELWVHPNATKHMNEFITKGNLDTFTPINSQMMLTEFSSSLDDCIKKGTFTFNDIQYGGNWEFKIVLKIRSPPVLLINLTKELIEQEIKMNKEYFIVIDGEKYKVNKEIYDVYYKSREKERYFMKTKKKGKTIIEDEKVTFEKSKEDSLERLLENNIEIADKFNLEDFVLMAMMIEKLNKALNQLTPEEYKIINEIFYNCKTEREIAREFNYKREKVKYLKFKILKKLRKIMKN